MLQFTSLDLLSLISGSTKIPSGSFETILYTARLLTNANVDIIGWMGTSPGWSGIEADEALYQFITAATGIPATTAVLF